ncbi:MAG: hypothetical protein NZZ60_08105 [Bacteroidia bacterium]|nr:hypothetical protein [Bacteroidia bacterium]MCX7651340.1 hypothetical protein [Bacteroidia bacterium]MDW8417140.1 hypothetical protein [Bacteroidia bacterium]
MKVYLICLSSAIAVWAQKSQILIAKLRPAPDITADNALHPSWEEKVIRLKITSEWEDEFISADDEDTDRSIAECFVPQIKIITERFTYVISLGCQNLIAYQNSAPFKPSPQRIQSPISFTDELQYFIEKVVEKHMKIPPKRLYADYSLNYVPSVQGVVKYEDIDLLLNQSQVIDEEDDDDEPDEPTESPKDWMSEEDIEDTDED